MDLASATFRMAGFVYIMSNPAFPGLLKIGRSRKDPTIDRVNELTLSAGVPQPFKVEYSAFVDDHELLESLVLDFFLPIGQIKVANSLI